MKTKISCSITIILFLSLYSFAQVGSKNVMLVLGSANPESLSNRVNIANRLYQIQHFDKIIVSGGCGAHASTICEATEMKAQLVSKGVPEKMIYKEENSKSTVQNYIFSRVLEDEKGEKIIEKGDSLFVVSDHWHAIAVAARFNKYDEVQAKFFIEGNIMPNATDLLDYGGIFNKETDNAKFVLKGIWPTPDAVFSENGCTEYVFSDRVYSVSYDRPKEATLKNISQFKPALPAHWKNIDAIAKDDKKKLLFVFNLQECQISSANERKNPIILKLSQLIIDLPTNIKKLDASFIKDNDLYLFSKNEVIIANRTGDKFKVWKIADVKEWVRNWPYAWASGDLDAADYNPKTKMIYLYKNREVLKIDEGSNSDALPEKLMIN